MTQVSARLQGRWKRKKKNWRKEGFLKKQKDLVIEAETTKFQRSKQYLIIKVMLLPDNYMF